MTRNKNIDRSSRSITKKIGPLLEFLLSLAPSGSSGFEGLIRNLLEAWIGEPFRLARAGSQRGKDATSSDGTANVIAAEMKRYDQKNRLSDRDLTGELQQVLDELPDLDIWILATTRELGEAEERNLRVRAQAFGIEAVVLDAREEGVGPLQAFCAKYPETVSAFCRDVTSFPEEILQARLVDIARHPGFQIQSSALIGTLQRALIGFDSIRGRAAKWLIEKLCSSRASMSTFFQDIGLNDEERAKPLQRKQISEELWSWWNNGQQYEWKCSVLGEEGVGKTWATMLWLLELADKPNAPILVPVSSGQVPHLNDIDEMVSQILFKRFGRTETFWKRRIKRWEPDRLGFPPILLWFDGLNEATRVPWRLLIEQAKGDTYREKIAILTTCRPGYWKSLFLTDSCNLISTEGYDDNELKQILNQAGRHLHDVPMALRELIRKPRYCDLVLQHFDKMAEDPTVERLLYEDYRNRWAKNAKLPVIPDDFCQILASLAEQYREGITNFRMHEISSLVGGASEAGTAIQEIIDGGLLVETGLLTSPFRVDSRRLIHGLGMLLADHLRVSAEKSHAEYLESIGAWLEPGPEMEIKAPVVGAAIFFATINHSYPASARRALLEYWLSRRNVTDKEEDVLSAYFPECPEDVLAVADSFWEEKNNNHVAEERLTWAILCRRDHPKVKPSLIEATKRWMSYVNIGSYPSNKNIHGEFRENAITAIRDRLGRDVRVDEVVPFDRWTFTIIDDDRKLFLSHLALKAICAGDRLAFVDAILCWAVSRSIMGRYFEDDDVAWALRLTDEPLWEVLKSTLDEMAHSESDILRKAANNLLWCLGKKECNNIRTELLHDLYPKQEWILEQEKDPCNGIFSLGRDQYQGCLTRDDIPINNILRKLNEYLPDPALMAPPNFLTRLLDEGQRLPLHMFHLHRMGKTVEDNEIETFIDVAARFYPKLAADIFRSIVRNIPNRTEEQQSYLLSYLPKISMLLSEDELLVLRNALLKIRSAITKGPVEGSIIHLESDGTKALHYYLSPDCVVDDLLSRPQEAFDNVDLYEFCQKISPDAGRRLLDTMLSPPNIKYLHRLLWLLPLVDPDLVTNEYENRLLGFLSGDDIELQCGAMRYAYFSNNDVLTKAVITGEVTFSSTSSNIHAYEAGILASYGNNLPIDMLAKRLSLPYLVRAVNKRGCVPGEIELIARIIDAIIPFSTQLPEGSDNCFVLTVAHRERHALRTMQINPNIMSAICEAYPDLVNRWMSVAVNESGSYLHILSGFYYSLCEAMLVKDSEDGIRLWRRIKSNRGSGITSSGIDWLVLIAFSALPRGAGRIVCDELLATANSDIELYRIVLAARKYGQEQWVLEKSEALIRSTHLWLRGKGLMLIALSDKYPQPFERALDEADIIGTWLERPSTSMKDIYDRNLWGKYWYEKFLTTAEDEEAFCAWHCFLKCIDARCQDWMKTLEEVFCLPGTRAAKRVQFCDLNESQVNHAIEDREKEYKDHFLTIKMRSSDWDRITPFYSEQH
ncbi:MAG: hypothetical protein WC007_16915 [Pelobacteraceae bacterium]